MSQKFLMKPSKKRLVKLNKAVKYLSNGYSSRSIELKVHTDRASIRRWFYGDLACSHYHAEKIRSAVIQRHLDYNGVLKHYGKRGLSAIYSFGRKQRDKENANISKQILSLRKKGVTYREISRITGRSLSSLQRTAVMNYGEKAFIGNVLFNSVNARDQKILADYKRGDSVTTLAVNYGLSPITIRGMLHDKYGHNRKPVSVGHRHFDRIQMLRDKNLSWADVAYVLGESTPQMIRKSYEEESFRRAVNEKSSRARR